MNKMPLLAGESTLPLCLLRMVQRVQFNWACLVFGGRLCCVVVFTNKIGTPANTYAARFLCPFSVFGLVQEYVRYQYIRTWTSKKAFEFSSRSGYLNCRWPFIVVIWRGADKKYLARYELLNICGYKIWSQTFENSIFFVFFFAIFLYEINTIEL